MSKLANKITQNAIAFFGENVIPIMKNSKFRETGMITPEEFVIAGDYLVYHCPTWQWEGGDVSRRKTYLPPDKQFLVTKRVPSYRRCHQISVIPENEKVIKLHQDDNEEEGWVDTHHGVAVEQLTEEVTDISLEDKPKQQPEIVTTQLVGVATVPDDSDSDDDGPVVDMDEYEEEDDPAVAPATKPAQKKPEPTSGSAGGDSILRTRTYDLNMTYDNYYRTPRLWLFGYSEKGQPLTEEEMSEDISQDHLNKTVTMENHPHLPPPPRASVHPCKHAELMKKITGMIEEGGREMEVHTYLLVFLKFVQAVIPTIEYDFTQQLSLVSS